MEHRQLGPSVLNVDVITADITRSENVISSKFARTLGPYIQRTNFE